MKPRDIPSYISYIQPELLLVNDTGTLYLVGR
ncbi:hypothetical protein WG66_010628 [Moniliophthora roreri]|nr:hypothetical protein WG66_010628 [Moniliophthora roreri]